MSEHTKIAWCDSTFNPWIGCTKVGPGCNNCYAKASWEDHKHRVVWGAGQARSRTQTWGDPVKWNKQHKTFFAAHGHRQRVFCASLADVFDNEVPREWRYDLLWLISNTPNLDWLLLTKRIGNAAAMLESECARMGWPWGEKYWSNIWIGATICNQPEADRDIQKLLAVPAAKHFLSMEPLLQSVDIGFDLPWRTPHVDWVIVGGESGPNARPMHPDWARSLRDQCQAASVPYFFKQWGEWAPDDGFISLRHEMFEWGEGLEITARSWRRGKKAAGRLLDGCEWNEVPA